MGCACSRENPLLVEEEYFFPFEQSLKITQKNAESFFAILKKHSVMGKIDSQFIESPHISKVFGLNKYFRFYQQFRDERHYNTKKLCCLVILIAKGSPETKTELLFDLFKDENLCCLTHATLETMIQCILSISCEIIPGYISTLHPDNTQLKEYLQNIKLVIRGTVNELVKDFLFCEKLSTKEGFMWRFGEKFDYLLSCRKAREFCYTVYEWVKKPTENTLKPANNDKSSNWNPEQLDPPPSKSRARRYNSNLV